MNFLKLIRQVLFQVGAPLFILTVLGSSMDQWITQQMESLLMNSDGSNPWIWFFGFLSLILNLTYPLAAVLLVLSSLQELAWTQFLRKNFQQSLIELMRSWGQMMLWSLLFILPGIYRYIQYLLVPFVVCFDPAYQRGEKDALKTARSQSKGGRFFWLLGLFLIFSITLPVLMTGFDEWKLIWNTPLSALIICLVEMLFNICFILGLWKIYQRSSLNESVVSVEGHSVPGPRTDI